MTDFELMVFSMVTILFAALVTYFAICGEDWE